MKMISRIHRIPILYSVLLGRLGHGQIKPKIGKLHIGSDGNLKSDNVVVHLRAVYCNLRAVFVVIITSNDQNHIGTLAVYLWYRYKELKHVYNMCTMHDSRRITESTQNMHECLQPLT